MKGRDKKGRFEKYYIPWNFKDGKRLKRKYKRFKNKLMLNAHVVWLKYNKLDEIPKGYIIHHKDGNSLNDNIDNLILMKDSEHKSLHNKKAGSSLIHNPHPHGQEGNGRLSPDLDVLSSQGSPADTPEEIGGGSNPSSSGTQSCENCGHEKKFHGMTKGVVCAVIEGLMPCSCKKFIPKTTDKKNCANCGKKENEHFSIIKYCYEAEFEDYQELEPRFKPIILHKKFKHITHNQELEK